MEASLSWRDGLSQLSSSGHNTTYPSTRITSCGNSQWRDYCQRVPSAHRPQPFPHQRRMHHTGHEPTGLEWGVETSDHWRNGLSHLSSSRLSATHPKLATFGRSQWKRQSLTPFNQPLRYASRGGDYSRRLNSARIRHHTGYEPIGRSEFGDQRPLSEPREPLTSAATTSGNE